MDDVRPAVRETGFSQITPGAAVPDELFVPLAEQLTNVRRWNDDLEWGFTAADFASVDLTPCSHDRPLVVDVIVPYLDDIYLGEDEEMDGVRRTCQELWALATEQQPTSFCFDWFWAEYCRSPVPVRLHDGIEHRPGIRRVTLDLAAHWKPGLPVRPCNVRGADSASAELLAAAAHFPDWICAMDGKRVPYVWLAGYQVTIPEESSHNRLLALTWTRFRHAISLAIVWADHSHSMFASPTCIGSRPLVTS